VGSKNVEIHLRAHVCKILEVADADDRLELRRSGCQTSRPPAGRDRCAPAQVSRLLAV